MGNFKLFAIDANQCETIYSSVNEHSSRINCIYYNEQKELILTGGNDEIINIWDYNAISRGTTSSEKKYSPIQFIEKLPVQDIQFVSDDWFMTITRGTTDKDGKGTVSLWSVNLKDMKSKLETLIDSNTHKNEVPESEVQKNLEN